MENDGLLTIRSSYSIDDTVYRLEQILIENDIAIFAKIDHSENANQANLNLRSTILILFGAPHIGTLLMQENQRMGIDLPSKALIWEDTKGNVWVSRNETSWFIHRHGMSEDETSLALENKINRLLHDAVAK